MSISALHTHGYLHTQGPLHVWTHRQLHYQTQQFWACPWTPDWRQCMHTCIHNGLYMYEHTGNYITSNSSVEPVHGLLTKDNSQFQCQVTLILVCDIMFSMLAFIGCQSTKQAPHKNEHRTEKWGFQCQLMFQGLGNYTMVERYAHSNCDIQTWDKIWNSFDVAVFVFQVLLGFKTHGFGGCLKLNCIKDTILKLCYDDTVKCWEPLVKELKKLKEEKDPASPNTHTI